MCFPIHLIKEGISYHVLPELEFTYIEVDIFLRCLQKKLDARHRAHIDSEQVEVGDLGVPARRGGKWRICGFSHFNELWPFYDSFHDNFFGTDQLNI